MRSPLYELARSFAPAAVLACCPLSLGGEDAAPASSAAIQLRPRMVYAGSTVTAALRPAGSSPSSRVEWEAVEWESSGGVLLADDLPEVEWKAPIKPGRIVLRADWLVDQAKARAELEVDVVPPATDGMVWIPPGVFLRGDVRGTRNTSEVKTVQNACDEPYDSVYLDEFWIDRYPVTNRKYVAFLEECLAQGMVRSGGIAVMGELDGSWVPFYYFQSYERLVPHFHESRNARKPQFLHLLSFDGSHFQMKPGKEDDPVVDVSWFGASAFARYYGKRLPTEAQWEKSARGTDGRRYTWGDALPTPYHALSDYYGPAEPTPVGRYSPFSDSPYGVCDMLSTCFEWTNDWFNANYYADYKSDTPARNPTGPFWGRSHSIRGLPYGMQFPQDSFDGTEPVSNRYSWFFEFEIGDTFGNRNTTFRTVIPTDCAPQRSSSVTPPVASHE